MVDPVIIDPRIMDALDRYMALNINDVSCLIAKFLGLYLTESPYLEPYEVDNFILRNGRFLALWYVARRDSILLTIFSIVLGNSMASSTLRYQISELFFYCGRWSWTRSLSRPLSTIGSFRMTIGSDGASRNNVLTSFIELIS